MLTNLALRPFLVQACCKGFFTHVTGNGWKAKRRARKHRQASISLKMKRKVRADLLSILAIAITDSTKRKRVNIFSSHRFSTCMAALRALMAATLCRAAMNRSFVSCRTFASILDRSCATAICLDSCLCSMYLRTSSACSASCDCEPGKNVIATPSVGCRSEVATDPQCRSRLQRGSAFFCDLGFCVFFASRSQNFVKNRTRSHFFFGSSKSLRVFMKAAAQVETLLNFSCIGGSQSLNRSRLLKFEKILEPDHDWRILKRGGRSRGVKMLNPATSGASRLAVKTTNCYGRKAPSVHRRCFWAKKSTQTLPSGLHSCERENLCKKLWRKSWAEVFAFRIKSISDVTQPRMYIKADRMLQRSTWNSERYSVFLQLAASCNRFTLKTYFAFWKLWNIKSGRFINFIKTKKAFKTVFMFILIPFGLVFINF